MDDAEPRRDTDPDAPPEPPVACSPLVVVQRITCGQPVAVNVPPWLERRDNDAKG